MFRHRPNGLHSVATKNKAKESLGQVVLMLSIIACSFAVASYTITSPHKVEPMSIAEINREKTKTLITEVDTTEYLWKMQVHESSCVYDTVNRLGYIGLYQFGRMAMTDVGLGHKYDYYRKNPSSFRPDLQILCMKRLMQVNTRYMEDYKSYVGTRINGVNITWLGILASCHLVGHVHTKKFLRSKGNIVASDGNKTSQIEYMKMFSNSK